MKCRLLFILALVLLFTSSCAILKRRVITKTETVIKVDTVIIVKRDTIPIVKTGYIHDTIKIENSTSRVVAFFDVVAGKYVVKLTGKPFTIPVEIKKRTMVITDIKTVDKKSNQWYLYVVIFLILGVWLLSLIKFVQKTK